MLMVINGKRNPYLRNAVNAICCSVKYLEPVAFIPGNKNVNQKSLFREGAVGGGKHRLWYIYAQIMVRSRLLPEITISDRE